MILFSAHAESKLEQRGLKKESVIQAIHHPDYLQKTRNTRMAAFKKIGKLYLKVIFKKEYNNIIIITQHWDEKFKPKG